MILYALVERNGPQAIDVFITKDAADLALREVLADEPAFADLLVIVLIPPPWQGRESIVLTPSPQ